MTEYLNIILVGDLVGTPGLNALEKYLPELVRHYHIEFVIVNGENVYDGKGIRPSDAQTIFETGAHVITSGNHIWERWQSKRVLTENTDVLRPLNYPRGNVGHGFAVKDLPHGGRIAVLNLQGRTFMSDIDCPFRAADFALEKIGPDIPVIVDFHAEVTAEKMAMAWYLEGRVSAVVGTHTHTQTGDARILPGGTAFLTDVGMTGPYDSVIGMKKEPAINRFLYKTPYKYETAEGDVRLCAVLLRLDRTSGKALAIKPITVPSFPTGQGFED